MVARMSKPEGPKQTHDSDRFPPRRDLATSLLLGLVCLILYNANLRTMGAGDTYPARYLPFAIWSHRTVTLDSIASVTAQGHVHPYWILKGRNGHAVSLYPVVLPVIVVPLYLPAVGYLYIRGWSDQRMDRLARVMEKLTASLIAALTAALMYLLLRRRSDPMTAGLLTLAFALGTNTWVISSQAMWQHGLAELLLVGALILLTGQSGAWEALTAGAICGLIAGNRPPDALLAAALGLYGLSWAGRRAPIFAAAAAFPIGLVLTYNLLATGNLAGGYGLLAPNNPGFFRHDLLPGIAGLLFSPARGLFVFSPFLLFLAFGFRHVLRDRSTRGLAILITFASIAQLMIYAKTDWRAGFSWGPRFLTDLLPLLVWMLPPVISSLRRTGRSAFVVAICASIAIQAVGAFWYTGSSEAAIFSGPAGPGEMTPAWRVSNAPFIAELSHPMAPMELLINVRGNIDRVSANGRDVKEVIRGTPVAIEGWALADDSSPGAVLITVDDNPLAVTTAFFDRSDVKAALHETSPAGWRAVIRSDNIRPGEHVLWASARVAESGEFRPIAQRRLTVRAKADAGTDPRPIGTPVNAEPASNEGLGVLAQHAVAILSSDQAPAGYWLTSYTSSPHFQNPKREMNTFLTSVMVDLLAPVAADTGLGETLDRARRHLAGQIEPSGLVRYHGRPDSPTIPSLGCVITPDADDTALVWRIAPGGDRSLTEALDVLKRYRTADGLYRTWLSSREKYQCIDPGRDPNPADVGIQMHVLMLLARSDASAARALCGALQSAIADDRIWVYYKVAPLIPLLRQEELRQGGCVLTLPESRSHTPVKGQETWVEAGRLLQRFQRSDGPPSSAETLATLKTLSNDGFASVRQNPPLLYHNDFTGSTPRFYWSEDFGYALWLRLYVEWTRDEKRRAGWPKPLPASAQGIRGDR